MRLANQAGSESALWRPPWIFSAANPGRQRFYSRGLRDEPTLEVDFIPHNPRLPGVLRRLQTIKYVRTLVTTLRYWGMLLVRIPRYDVIHVFSAAYYSYLLSVMPAILIAKAVSANTQFSTIGAVKLRIISNTGA